MGILDHILLGFEAVLYGSGVVTVLGIGLPLPLLMVCLGLVTCLLYTSDAADE